VERLARPRRARTEKACAIIDDLIEPVVPVVQGQVVTCGDYPLKWARMASGFRGIFSETQTETPELRLPAETFGFGLSAGKLTARDAREEQYMRSTQSVDPARRT